MYNYEWDIETGGYVLTTKITGVTKEVRPVYFEELKFLGFDTKYGWTFPDAKEPLLWAEGRRYIYKGQLVAEAVGGGLYDMPVLKNVVERLNIEPVNVALMVKKNENIMNGLVQTTLKTIYDIYTEQRKKVDISYKRADNSLAMHIIKGIVAKINAYYKKIHNQFGYCELSVQIESGTMDGERKDCKYYLSSKKIYSKRFSTDCFSDFFVKKALRSPVGINDLPEYYTEKATFNELAWQNSYFVAKLVTGFTINDLPIADGDLAKRSTD